MPGSAFPCKQGTLYFVAPKTSKTSTHASCAVRAGARSRKSVCERIGMLWRIGGCGYSAFTVTITGLQIDRRDTFIWV